MEKRGDFPIPIELNILGLPIEPPFFRPVNRSYNLGRLLARMHMHTVFGKFLFDPSVYVDEFDHRKNLFTFDYTPPLTRFE